MYGSMAANTSLAFEHYWIAAALSCQKIGCWRNGLGNIFTKRRTGFVPASARPSSGNRSARGTVRSRDHCALEQVLVP